MRSVTNERALLRMFHRNSSRKVLIERKASTLSWMGRMSERITSLEREERYWGPGEARSASTVVPDDGLADAGNAETDRSHHSQ